MKDGKEFWELIENISPFSRWMDFAEKCGMSYNTVKQQRHDKTIPRTSDIVKIAEALNVSVDYLLTGKEKNLYDDRINKIAWHCQNIASDEDLFIIERILGIQSQYEIVKKSENKRKNSGIA